MAQIKPEKSIFKKARPTKSSLVRDKELENQRAARRQEFLSKEVGYIELAKQNQTKGNKFKFINLGQKKMKKNLNLRSVSQKPSADIAKEINVSEIYKMK